MTMVPGTSLEVNAGLHRARATCAKPSFHFLTLKCPVGSAKPKQNTCNQPLALQVPFGSAEKNMTAVPGTSLEVNAGLHRARATCAKPSFHFLTLKCPVGSAKPRQNTRNQPLAPHVPFGTTEETMTTAPETSLEVNASLTMHARNVQSLVFTP